MWDVDCDGKRGRRSVSDGRLKAEVSFYDLIESRVLHTSMTDRLRVAAVPISMRCRDHGTYREVCW